MMKNKSKPLTEGKIKTNVKNTTECIKAAPPPPPLPKHKTVENKTAVEWLIDMMEEQVSGIDYVNNRVHISISFEDFMYYKKEANEMFQKQIEEAYTEGLINCPPPDYIGKVVTSSDYFIKTYKNETKQS